MNLEYASTHDAPVGTLPAFITPPPALGSAAVSGTQVPTARKSGKLEAAYKASGDQEAQILRHLPLVQTVVEKVCAHLPPTVDKDDLFHAGVIGLIDALGRYDPSQGTQFSTYAVLRIRGQVIDELRARDWVPRSVREKAREYQQAVSVLSQRLNRLPTEAELCAALKCTPEDLTQIEAQAHLASQVSLDAPIGEDETLGSRLARIDDENANPARHLEREDSRKILARVLKTLTEQERLVIKLYYFESLLMKEIAMVLGVTESRVCQIHSRVVAVLRLRLGRELP